MIQMLEIVNAIRPSLSPFLSAWSIILCLLIPHKPCTPLFDHVHSAGPRDLSSISRHRLSLIDCVGERQQQQDG